MGQRPGGNIDGAVDLKVQEVFAGECMVFIAKDLSVAEAVGSWGVSVVTQLDVQVVVGTAKPERLGTEVVRALVKVVGCVEGWVEVAVRVQFGGMGGWGEVFNPPSAVHFGGLI